MPHRFIAALAVVQFLVPACGGGGAGPATSPPGATGEGTATTAAPTDDGEVLPPPDPASFDGRSRVVNLYVDGDGNTMEVDVWAKRSFTGAPVLLSEGIGFGEVSDYFATPEGHSIAIVETGGGPDAEEVGGLFNATADAQNTTLFIWDGEETGAASLLFEELGPDPINPLPELPGPGSGMVLIHAGQLRPHSDDFAETSFHVGAPGTGTCLAQAAQVDTGGQQPIVGGTQRTTHQAPAGMLAFALHAFPGEAGVDPCAGPPVHGPYEVTVPDGGASWVFLYTTDGLGTIEVLEAPWGEA